MKDQKRETMADLNKRMRRIEGQARGIQRMIDEKQDCKAILIQLAAMREAITKVGMKAIGCHLAERLDEALQAGCDGRAAIDEAVEYLVKFP